MITSVQQLLNLSVSGLYCLINDDLKKVYISYSNNILSSLGRNVEDIQNGCHRYISVDQLPHLELKVLQEEKNRNLQRIQLAYWIDHYKSLGYTLYRNYPGLRYQIDYAIQRGWKKYNQEYFVYVYLKSQSRNNVLIGIFDNLIQAKSFVADTYKDSPYYYPVSAYNSLTREYYVLQQKHKL